MDNIKLKSEENIKAAQLLINNNMYASSVHCTYYACFQLMKYVLHTKLNCSYNIQNQLNKEKGSHDKIIQKFLEQALKIKNNKRVASNITNSMYKLKERRVQADYSSDEIKIDFINEVTIISDEINKELNNI